jgi:AraC-like DNA-binding protein
MMRAILCTLGHRFTMSEKDTISIHLVREALLQSCAPGAASDEVLQRAGVDPHLLAEPTARVSATAYARLWRLLARRMDDEFFGMDPRKLKSGSLAFLCRTAMAQPTLVTSLESGLGFLSLMLERLPAQLVRQQSLAEIVLLEPESEPNRAFTYFTYWMIVHGVACWLAGRRIPILAIELRCPKPAFCDDYQVMFSDNLRFDRPRTRMIFSADCLDLPIKRSTEELKRFLAHAPANILVKYRDPDSLATRIKHDLRQMPPDTWPETDGLAASLCISASTLRRRLAEEGQTYQGIKDSVRKELAIVWLAEPQISFAEIAERLGFADTSSFYKAFRKWVGSNPGQYRSLILNETNRL